MKLNLFKPLIETYDLQHLYFSDGIKETLKRIKELEMSYDIHIGNEWINHTYNGCEVCAEIINMTPSGFDGKPACIVYKLAKEVHDTLKNNKKKYAPRFKEYDNWGTVNSWIEFMADIMQACKINQTAIVEVS